MKAKQLSKDPFNIIITGVGGQGNVMASRILSNMLVNKGYFVTIGETFGASQRGGSVISHIRVSSRSAWGPLVPKGRGDVVVTLEPIEAIRVLAHYGNPAVEVLANTRAVYPASVTAGESTYPTLEEIKEMLKKLAARVWLIDATDEAVKLGNSILSNIIMMGALSAVGHLPIDQDDFTAVISRTLPPDKIADNLQAFALGVGMMKEKRRQER